MLRAIAALGLLVPLLLLPVDAGAQAPMCGGRQATLVGEAGQGVLGTDGPDVIVSNGARFVHGGSGDDLICMTRQPEGRYSKVWGELGDDTIRVVGGKRTFVIPGPGDDRVLRGPTTSVPGRATTSWICVIGELSGTGSSSEPGTTRWLCATGPGSTRRASWTGDPVSTG